MQSFSNWKCKLKKAKLMGDGGGGMVAGGKDYGRGPQQSAGHGHNGKYK